MSTPFKSGKFNRLTLDENNHSHRAMLNTLRQRGRSRRYAFHQCKNRRHEDCCASTSFRWLRLVTATEKQIYVDFGCGESPDVLIAAGYGYRSFGVDLVPPNEPYDPKVARFVKADVCEKLQFKDSTVDAITMQAITSLILEEERERVYREAFRMLRPGGMLAVVGPRLSHGYHYEVREEIERAERVFDLVSSMASGFLAVK